MCQDKEICMSLIRLRRFLDSYTIRYVVISHSVAYTAGGIAALTHIPGKEVAKTVIVKIDDALAMAVVSASQHVDLELLKQATKAKTVRLAAEDEFKNRFPDCETGAMPPFGNLYGMSVYADEVLSHDQEIVFNAGSHRELVRVAWEDFERLVQPKVMKLAEVKRAAEAA
jgi:Ala-tRNA(Pro) deacylase